LLLVIIRIQERIACDYERIDHGHVYNEIFFHWNLSGARTVKWTPLDPCSSLSESDPKLCTNYEFYEIEIHKHLESI